MPFTLTETTHVNKDYTKAVPGESTEARWVLGGPGMVIEDDLARRLGLLEEGQGAGVAIEGTPLPDDFPARTILVQHGYDTVEKLMDVPLTTIPGIGKTYVGKINQALTRLPVEQAEASAGVRFPPEAHRLKG